MKLSKSKFTPLSFLEQAGVNQNELLAFIAKENELNTEDTAFKSKFLVYLLPAAVTLSNDPSLAMRLGLLPTLSSLGILGFAIQSCSTLKQTLSLLMRYHPILKMGVQWKLNQYEKGLTLRFNVEMGSPEQQRLMTELAFSNWFHTVRTLTNKPTVAAELHLNYPKPDNYKIYKEFLPVHTKFNQPYNQILLSEEILEAPLKYTNPAEHVIFQQLCEEMLRGLSRIENTSAAVRRLLIQSAGNFPNIDQVANKLHMSKSTLGRRLENESSSFRTIFDEVKNLLAKEYLTNTELTVADIAHLLDYTDTANFRRAFVRWNKVTPSEFREETIA